jgi:hypothetical protein
MPEPVRPHIKMLVIVGEQCVSGFVAGISESVSPCTHSEGWHGLRDESSPTLLLLLLLQGLHREGDGAVHRNFSFLTVSCVQALPRIAQQESSFVRELQARAVLDAAELCEFSEGLSLPLQSAVVVTPITNDTKVSRKKKGLRR